MQCRWSRKQVMHPVWFRLWSALGPSKESGFFLTALRCFPSHAHHCLFSVLQMQKLGCKSDSIYLFFLTAILYPNFGIIKTNKLEHPTCLVICWHVREPFIILLREIRENERKKKCINHYNFAAPNIPLLGMIPKIPNISFYFLFFIPTACRTNFLWA